MNVESPPINAIIHFGRLGLVYIRRAPKADHVVASLFLFLVSKPLDQLLIFVTIWSHSSSSIYICLKNIVTPATSVRCSTNISSILRHCQDMFFPLGTPVNADAQKLGKYWHALFIPSVFVVCNLHLILS